MLQNWQKIQMGYIYTSGGWGGSPAYPQTTKFQIEQKALPRGEF